MTSTERKRTLTIFAENKCSHQIFTYSVHMTLFLFNINCYFCKFIIMFLIISIIIIDVK